MTADPRRDVARLLAAAAAAIGGRTPRLDAELLLAHSGGVTRESLLLAPVAPGPAAVHAFHALVDRRRRGEPVAYLTGRVEFWSLSLAVDHRVLVPRPDSETLIEVAQRRLAGRPPGRVLDLGTGSGALLAAALSIWPGAMGLGVDRSPAALAVARANLAALRLGRRAALAGGDWAGAVCGRFDLVLANPPYLRTDEAMPSIAEPANALYAGADGLTAYRALLPQLPRLLAPGGVAVLEIGEQQTGGVCALAASTGLAASVHPDLAGRPRAVLLAGDLASAD